MSGTETELFRYDRFAILGTMSFRLSTAMLGLFARLSATAARLGGAAANGAVILNYHSVGDPFHEAIFPGNCVSKSLFAAQMRFIRKHGHPLTLDDLAEALRGERPLPDRAIAITFDDGYRGVLNHALPILECHRIPATIFLPTDWIATGAEKWDDRLSRAVLSSGSDAVECRDGNGHVHRHVLARPADRLQALLILCRLAPKHPQEATETWVDGIVAQCGKLEERRDALLSPAEIRKLSDHPLVSFGSHSASHRHLGSLSLDEFRHDLRRSRDQVEHWTNRSCRHFAWPYGQEEDLHPRAAEILSELGFSLALTTFEGTARRGDDLFQLRRILAHPDDSPALFELKVHGAHEAYRRRYASLRTALRG